MAVEVLLLTPADVARQAKVSVKTVYRAIGSGKLKASWLGGYRITPESYWQWIEAAAVARTSDPSPIPAPRPLPARGSLEALRAIERAA